MIVLNVWVDIYMHVRGICVHTDTSHMHVDIDPHVQHDHTIFTYIIITFLIYHIFITSVL